MSERDYAAEHRAERLKARHEFHVLADTMIRAALAAIAEAIVNVKRPGAPTPATEALVQTVRGIYDSDMGFNPDGTDRAD